MQTVTLPVQTSGLAKCSGLASSSQGVAVLKYSNGYGILKKYIYKAISWFLI